MPKSTYTRSPLRDANRLPGSKRRRETTSTLDSRLHGESEGAKMCVGQVYACSGHHAKVKVHQITIA